MDLKNKDTKKNIVSAILALIITAVFLINSSVLNHLLLSSVLALELVMLAIMLLMVATIAGFVVVKSLFLVAAELSLLIFLAQSYCSVPHTITGDSALRGLFVIGLLYISYVFLHSLYESLVEYHKKIENEKLSWDKIIAIVLFLSFILFFMWDVYQIVGPITVNLCVFK
jgi:hypothetical protein